MKNVMVYGLFILSLILPRSGARSQEKFYNYYDKGIQYILARDWVRAVTELRSAASLEFEDKQKKRTYGTRFIEYYPHRELGIAYYHLGELDNARKELELSLAYKGSDRGKEYMKKVTAGSPQLSVDDKAELDAIKKLEEEERIALEKETTSKAESDRIQKELEVKAKAEEEQKVHAEAERKKAEARLQKEVEAKKKEEGEKERKRIAAEEEARKAKEAEERKQLEIAQKKAEDERKKNEEEKIRLAKEKEKLAKKNKSASVSIGALAYDASRVIQVGSRLAVAVLPFEETGSAGQNGTLAAEKLVTQLVNFRRFRVIERAEMDKVMKEQDFALTDAVDEKAAAKLGKLAGADVIVVGRIVSDEGFAKVSARLVDVETGETIVAKEVQTKSIGLEEIERSVSALSVLIYNDLPIFEGYIVNIDNDGVYIDIGSDKGMRKGMKCVAFKEGDPIIHPITKEVLGKKVTKLGELVIVQVQEKMSVAKFVEKENEKIEISNKIVIK